MISRIKQDKLVLNTLYLLGFVLCWSLDFILTTSALRVGLKPVQLVTLRFLVAAVFLLVFLVDDRFFKTKFSLKTWFLFALAGLTGVTLAQGLQVIKRYSHIPSAPDLVFIMSLTPLFILFLSFLFLREKVSWPKICGVLMGLVGVALIVANWERPSTFAPFVLHRFEESFVLAAALSWGFFTVLMKKIRSHTSFENAAALVISIGLAPVLITGLSTQGLKLFAIDSNQWFFILLLGLISSAYAYIFWFKALDFWEASSAGGVLFLTPVIVTLFILLERALIPALPSPLVIGPVVFGSILILVGVSASLLMTVVLRGELGFPIPLSSRAEGEFPSGLIIFLVVLAVASFLSAGMAACWPAKISLIKGVLDNRQSYSKQWTTLGYEMAAVYLLLLAGLVNIVLAWRLKRKPVARFEIFFWTGVSALLLIGFWFARGTTLINWLDWMPPEIQFAIGTVYVSLKENLILSWPSVASFIFSSMFNVMVVALLLLKPGADVIKGRQNTEEKPQRVKDQGSRVK